MLKIFVYLNLWSLWLSDDPELCEDKDIVSASSNISMAM